MRAGRNAQRHAELRRGRALDDRVLIGKTGVPADAVHGVHRPGDVLRPGCDQRANVSIHLAGNSIGREGEVKGPDAAHANVAVRQFHILVFTRDKPDAIGSRSHGRQLGVNRPGRGRNGFGLGAGGNGLLEGHGARDDGVLVANLARPGGQDQRDLP